MSNLNILLNLEENELDLNYIDELYISKNEPSFSIYYETKPKNN